MLLPDFKGGDEKSKYRLIPVVKYIERHELNHCRINTEHATMLENSLLKLGWVDCAKLSCMAQAEYRRIRYESRRTQKGFDKYEIASKANSRPWVHFNYFSETLSTPKNSVAKDVGNLKNDMDSSGIYQNKDGSWSNY